MMCIRRGAPAFLFALLAVGPAGAQDAPESVRDLQVREILASIEGGSVAAIWSRSEELIRMGQPAARAIRSAVPQASVEGKLAALRALVELDQRTYAASELLELARDEAVALPLRLLALELVGRADEPDSEADLVELLDALNPQIRVAAARALWNLGSQRSQLAKDALREVFRSSDPELRAEGALALAGIGDSGTPGVLETLRDLAKEPGQRGRLAAALYEKLTLQDVVARLRAKAETGSEGPGGRSGLWSHLDEIRHILETQYDAKEGIPVETLRALAARGLLDLPDDPHTAFLDPAEHREWMMTLDPHYGGIGALIDTNAKEVFRILRPFFGGPAWKADIRTGDIITAVNGVPTEGRRAEEIIKQVKGPPGTPVVLTILREGWAEPRDIEVIRARIVLPTVHARMLPGNVGYIEITNFGDDTGDAFEKELRALEARGMRGLVIDLRWNPGGSLAAVKQCLTPFLRPRELICTVASSKHRGRVEPHLSGVPDRARDYPISVLVNERSASGAELMSGVLQHYSTRSAKAAAETRYLDVLVLGKESFGKGTVQAKVDLASWPGERFVDEPRKNGQWDPGERFVDRNGNGLWDPGEPFDDVARPNGRWDDGEGWEDQNGNGVCDPGERFEDANGDGVWNGPEKYEDANGNGAYDYGAAAKLTIARYYLPGGRNFTRERVQKNGGWVWVGGVVPDIELDQPKLLASHIAEFQELAQAGKLREYVRTRWDRHKATFYELAYEDGRDPSRYPDFDACYAESGTRLTRQEFRRALRAEVRREVCNDMGREIVADLSDDVVLRRGCEEVLRRLGVDPASVPELGSIAKHAEP
jgi:C-terminal peptidase prc